MSIEFIQLVPCVVERTEFRAHDRSEPVRKETQGLLGVDRDGKVWNYNYAKKSWDEFSRWQTS